MMTEACGTNCTIMEMGGATSSMMKVRGTTKSNSRNYIGSFLVIDKRIVYFMMRQKLLYRIDGCVWSNQSYDDSCMLPVVKWPT